MALKLGVIIYSGADRASEVLAGFQQVHPSDTWTLNIGTVERHKSGRISFYGGYEDVWEWEEEGGEPVMGLSLGGVTGLLIGALAGPTGMAVGGALGGAMGGLLGAADEESAEPLREIIRGKLAKGSSALVLLADAPYVDALIAATRDDAREVYEQDVREELRGRLDEALREAAARPVPQVQQPAPSTQTPVH